jgi:hypothetical protein
VAQPEGQDAARPAGSVVRRSLPDRQLPLLGARADDASTTSTPLSRNTLPTSWLPVGARSSAEASVIPDAGLPTIRLRATRFRRPPAMPAPMPKPPSACAGLTGSALCAMTLPTIVASCCGMNASWYSEFVVSPTRLPANLLRSTYIAPDALAPS